MFHHPFLGGMWDGNRTCNVDQLASFNLRFNPFQWQTVEMVHMHGTKKKLQNGGFLKYGYHQIINFSKILHSKPSMLGYPHWWKPPNRDGYGLNPCEAEESEGPCRQVATFPMKSIRRPQLVENGGRNLSATETKSGGKHIPAQQVPGYTRPGARNEAVWDIVGHRNLGRTGCIEVDVIHPHVITYLWTPLPVPSPLGSPTWKHGLHTLAFWKKTAKAIARVLTGLVGFRSSSIRSQWESVHELLSIQFVLTASWWEFPKYTSPRRSDCGFTWPLYIMPSSKNRSIKSWASGAEARNPHIWEAAPPKSNNSSRLLVGQCRSTAVERPRAGHCVKPRKKCSTNINGKLSIEVLYSTGELAGRN